MEKTVAIYRGQTSLKTFHNIALQTAKKIANSRSEYGPGAHGPMLVKGVMPNCAPRGNWVGTSNAASQVVELKKIYFAKEDMEGPGQERELHRLWELFGVERENWGLQLPDKSLPALTQDNHQVEPRWRARRYQASWLGQPAQNTAAAVSTTARSTASLKIFILILLLHYSLLSSAATAADGFLLIKIAAAPPAAAHVWIRGRWEN